MNKLSGLLNGLKKVAKISVYLLAFVKILDFAIATLDDINPKPEEQKELENE